MGSVVRGTRLCVVWSLLLPPTYTVHSTQYTVESIDTMVWYVVALLYIVSPVFTGDLNRQSVIFNENTPDVFYCPQDKPISIDRMLVKSKPMKKLCEHEGRPLPEGAKSDCWNDVDETEYACSGSHLLSSFWVHIGQTMETSMPGEFTHISIRGLFAGHVTHVSVVWRCPLMRRHFDVTI